jgi:hypothetical protein
MIDIDLDAEQIAVLAVSKVQAGSRSQAASSTPNRPRQ